MTTERPVVITVATEFYNVSKNYDSGNYLVQDNTYILSDRDTALLHISSKVSVLAIYLGQRILRDDISYAILEPDNRTVAKAAFNTGSSSSVFIRVVNPQPRTLVKTSEVIQEEQVYYDFDYEIAPIETTITFDEAPAPINPIVPVPLDKELIRDFAHLLDQVQNASNIYEIIKTQVQCTSDITLKRAVKCNKLLRKAVY